jgi:hypothetical protein
MPTSVGNQLAAWRKAVGRRREKIPNMPIAAAQPASTTPALPVFRWTSHRRHHAETNNNPRRTCTPGFRSTLIVLRLIRPVGPAEFTLTGWLGLPDMRRLVSAAGNGTAAGVT